MLLLHMASQLVEQAQSRPGRIEGKGRAGVHLLAGAHKGIEVAAVPVGEALLQQLLLLRGLLLAQRLRVVRRWRYLRLYYIL